ncbi:uncharacterized protein AtWU_04745 [Aspergillus tubingensis]|uniref:uncharacterized protein n=1 Tax=Aspergillus tubingensis TaxID=5068 RepID=UPI001578E20C|nr:uncharacterized protein AtWU_04745 [Aspergillus tubingensis]GFN14945.1 hypothetical protein AtWU_04745 [Aspergillus tubingensis]
MRNSIESSSDLIHHKEDEECDNSDKSDDLLDSTLSNLSVRIVGWLKPELVDKRPLKVCLLLFRFAGRFV